MVRVLIADGQPLFRTGLVRLLNEDRRLLVLGEAANGPDLIHAIGRLRPDVVVTELSIPGLEGTDIARQIRAVDPDVRVLILSSEASDGRMLRVLRGPASGYLLKDAPIESLVDAILAAASGAQVVAGDMAQRALSMLSGTASAKQFYDGLTGREVGILRQVAMGRTNKQIAVHLRISEKTVRNHMSNVYAKLGIFDRSQAVLYAVRKGLVEA